MVRLLKTRPAFAASIAAAALFSATGVNAHDHDNEMSGIEEGQHMSAEPIVCWVAIYRQKGESSAD